MQKTRKTSHITNIIQFDADGHVVIPASLTLGIAPGADDNSAKVPSTAWVRSIVTTAGGAYVPTGRTITINGVSYDLSANRSWSINTGVLTATAGAGISVSTVDANLNIVNTGLLTATAGAGISVSTVNQNLNIVNTGLLTATAGAGISVSTVNQNLNIVSTAILTATAGSGISVSVVDQNLNIVNTGILTATAGSGISLSVVGQNLNVVNTGLRTATAGSGISISVVDGNLNIVNTITNNNQLTNGADYATTSFVTTQINNLVSGAPGLLDTLDELAQALGDDPNFATTVTTALSNRLRIDTASQGLNSTQQSNGRTNLGLGSLAVLSSVANAQITDVAWSKVTGAPAFITGNQTITLSGDATGSGATAITVTLANSGVTAGTYTKVTVDAKGRVTAGASLASGDLPTYTGTLTSSQVTTALGYTPYNSSNPSGYITSAALAPYLLLAGGSMTGNISFGSSGAGLTWAANTDGASITFESTGDGASGGRALSNLLIALTDNGDEGLKVTTTGSELLYVNINQFQYKGSNVWTAANLTNLNQLTNGPGYITGYTETDTLATVTARGATTSTALTLSGNVAIGGLQTRSNINFENQNGFHRIAFWDLRFWDWDTGTDIFTLGQGDGNVRVTNSLLIAGNTAWHQGNLTNLNQLANGPGYVTGGPYLPTAGGTMTGSLRFNEGGYGRIAFTDNYHGMILRGIPNNASGDVTSTDVTSLVQHSGDFRFYRTNGSINELYFQVNASGLNWRGNTVLHSGNFSSWAQPYVYRGQNAGNWQGFTDEIGEFRVDEVLDITNGNHSNHPTGVYTYGGVMSWRTNNHSFQLYAAHTGDLAYKTQWGNDNFSGWRRILDSSTYPFAANMNQYVRTSDDVTFSIVRGTSYMVTPLIYSGGGNVNFGNNIGLNGNNAQIQFNAAASADLFISAIPGTRTIEIRNGNAGSPNYAACGLITGYATFTSNITVQGSLTVSSNNTTGGGIILADDGDIVDLNDGYAAMRFSLGVRIFSANRGGSAVITLGNTGAIQASGPISASNISNGVTASHIVQRDANGYIYANHINFNTSESENPSISSFITSNGDGWSRKSSLAHVKNQIRGVADGTWGINITGSASNSSQLGGWTLQQVVPYHSGSDFINGTLVVTSINAAVSEGASFVMEVTGKSYGSGPAPFGLMLEGYLYANTIINSGAISYGSWFPGPIRILNYNGNLAFWWPRGSYWNSFSVSVREAGGSSLNTVTSILDVAEPASSKKVSVSIIQTLNSNNYNSYSPTLTGGNASGTWGINITGNAVTVGSRSVGNGKGNIAYWDAQGNCFINNPEAYSGEVRLGAAWNRGGIYTSNRLSLSTGNGEIDFVSTDNSIGGFRWDSSNGSRFIVGLNANIATPHTLIDTNRRPVMYARGAYPVLTLDHTETSNTNHGPTIQFAHNGTATNRRQWVIGTNGTGTRLDIGYSDGSNNTDYNPHNGIAGYQGSTFMRFTTTGVLIGDCGTLSNPNLPGFALEVRGAISCTDIVRTSNFRLAGTMVLSGSGAEIGNSTGTRLSESYGALWNFSNSATWHHQIINGSSLVGFQSGGGNFGNGNIYASGDVVAYYSDKRLKHNLNKIDNAVEKISRLTGYTYQHNDLGQELLNENPHKVHAGLIAQEVQEVLPEVVTIAPFDLYGYDEYGNGISNSGENYLTIKYERMVPLLIEAIKEQQAQIEDLKNQITELKENK